jgi:hypothetical protein
MFREEFRLFHNLFYDAREDKYIKFDDNGDPEEPSLNIL